MKKSYQDGIPENVRIRHYIMSLLYHGGMKSIQLPSSTQLSKEFGIARSTVLLALKQLREEGYIIGKHGIGVFTNPRYRWRSPGTKKLVGLLNSSGDCFYYEKERWEGLAAIGNALTDANYNVRILNVNINNRQELRCNLEKQSLDALVMIHADSGIAKEISAWIPSILIGHQPSAELPSIRFSYEKGLRTLRREVRFQRPMFFGEQYWMFENNFRPFWSGQNIPQSRKYNHLNPEEPEFEEKVQQLIAKEHPDILFIMPELADGFSLALNKRRIDIPAVSWRSLPKRTLFRGYCFREPYPEAAKYVTDMLDSQFSSGEMPMEPVELDVPWEKTTVQ